MSMKLAAGDDGIIAFEGPRHFERRFDALERAFQHLGETAQVKQQGAVMWSRTPRSKVAPAWSVATKNRNPPTQSSVSSTHYTQEANMAQAETSRGRAQDRARVAGGQDHEVQYEAAKTGKSTKAVKEAVKSAGNSRSAVEKTLGAK